MATAAETRSRNPVVEEVPEFVPPSWLRNGHAQTIVGRYLPGPRVRLHSTYHEMAADERDRLVVLESVPPGWSRGDPAAILIHGLAGCAAVSVRGPGRGPPAPTRGARRPHEPAGGGRRFRAGAGIYHAGRTEDLRTVARWLAGRAAGLADRAGRFLARREPGPEARGGVGDVARRGARLRARGQSARSTSPAAAAISSRRRTASTTGTSSSSSAPTWSASTPRSPTWVPPTWRGPSRSTTSTTFTPPRSTDSPARTTITRRAAPAR